MTRRQPRIPDSLPERKIGDKRDVPARLVYRRELGESCFRASDIVEAGKQDIPRNRKPQLIERVPEDRSDIVGFAYHGIGTIPLSEEWAERT